MLFYANKKGIIFRSLKTFLTFKHFHVCFPAISIETFDRYKDKSKVFHSRLLQHNFILWLHSDGS